MENPSRDQGSAPLPPAGRSRTRRDPSVDEVYIVPPHDFAHTVQRLTGAACLAPTPSSRSSRSSPPESGPVAASAPPQPSTRPLPAPALSVSTPTATSMQEAYLAWCASNDVVLSPGTMAEMESGPVAASAPPQPSTRPLPAPALSVSTPTATSMQEAYLAWCASNNVVLSPGTMAEMERAAAKHS
ncbi:predicted GPI-anchored protein 58 [Phragmites australis]|uniref:predicted GPI-anchored protein 58 n=1 Tax=Phragmites australis TaxID=29695 RepID=UPI002D79867B|nr:predicted GPI-anchored protein 58 [Phragmites australis]